MNIETLSLGTSLKQLDNKNRVFIPSWVNINSEEKAILYLDQDIIKMCSSSILEAYYDKKLATLKSISDIDEYNKIIEQISSKVISVEKLDAQRRMLFTEVLKIKKFENGIYFQGLGYSTALYTKEEVLKRKLTKDR